MKRKGQVVLKPIVELLLGIAVVASLFFIGKGYASHDFAIKSFLAQETALVVDALYDVPGNMYLSYPFDFSRYVLQLDNGNIVVESQIKNFNHYFPFLGKVVQDTVRNQKLFGLSRDGDVLSIGETSLQRFRC